MTKTKTQKARAAVARGAMARSHSKSKHKHQEKVEKKRKASVQSIASVAAPIAAAAATAVAKKAAGMAAPVVSRVAEGLRQFATQEEQYMYGFVDPENGAPGPGDAQYSTYVTKHRGYNDMTVADLGTDTKSGLNYVPLNGPISPATSWTPDVAGTLANVANNDVYTNGAAYRVNNTDPVTFVACPHYVRGLGGITPSGSSEDSFANRFISRAVMGFQCSNVAFGQSAYSNRWIEADGTVGSNDSSWMKPLSNYDIDLFASTKNEESVQKAPNVTDVTQRNTTSMVRHRIVGLKLGVICNSPALTVTGQVVGGDNRFIYGVVPEYARRENAGGSLINANTPTLDAIASFGVDPSEVAFTGRTFSQSRRDLGALSHGEAYESVFIPASDHIMEWISVPGVHSALSIPREKITDIETSAIQGGYPLDAAHYSYQRIIDMCMNLPMAYITITGAPAGTTFRVFTSVAIENVVLNDNPLALVRESARMARRYLPDWGELAGVPSSCCGDCGVAAKAIMKSPKLLHGMSAAAGLLAKETGKRTDSEMYSIGASNAASELGSAPQVRAMLRRTPAAAVVNQAIVIGPTAAAKAAEKHAADTAVIEQRKYMMPAPSGFRY